MRETDCEVTVAKTACGSRSAVFAIPSVVGLSTGGLGTSEATWSVSVSAAATTSSIAACAQVAKIEGEGELKSVTPKPFIGGYREPVEVKRC